MNDDPGGSGIRLGAAIRMNRAPKLRSESAVVISRSDTFGSVAVGEHAQHLDKPGGRRPPRAIFGLSGWLRASRISVMRSSRFLNGRGPQITRQA